MPILFHMLLPTSCASKWYQWLRIWLSRNIRFVGVNVGMSARNRHFQTNYWCITMMNSILIWISRVILIIRFSNVQCYAMNMNNHIVFPQFNGHVLHSRYSELPNTRGGAYTSVASSARLPRGPAQGGIASWGWLTGDMLEAPLVVIGWTNVWLYLKAHSMGI